MPRSAGAIAAALLVVVVAACGSSGPTPAPSSAASASTAPPASADASAPPAASASAAPSSSAAPSAPAAPSASAEPSPSASAGPDVAAAFNKAIGDSLFRPHVVVKGVATVAGQTIVTSGTIDVSYIATRTVMTTVAGGKRTTTDKITTDTKTYERKFGQYFEGKNDPSGADLVKVITKTGGFVERGMDSHNGQLLHHLTLNDPSAVSGADLGLDASIAASAKVTLEGWADDTGTPKAMLITATWDQPVDGGATTPAQMAMDLAFDGASPTVSEPSGDHLWAIRTSKYFKYKVGTPSDWTFKSGSSKHWDWFYGYDGYAMTASGWKANGWTVNSWSLYAIKHPGEWSNFKKAHATSSKGAKMGGTTARTFQVWGTSKGVVWYDQVAMAAHGGKIYTLVFETSHKPTADDKAMFASAMATFSFK